jgi:hypothetical protein
MLLTLAETPPVKIPWQVFQHFNELPDCMGVFFNNVVNGVVSLRA